jgi:hypothetical protein
MSAASLQTGPSAIWRQFSPDMKTRWLPTVDGNITLAPGQFSFATRAEAITAARVVARKRKSSNV